MAFNPYKVEVPTYQRPVAPTETSDTTPSILSELQSLWVLFNPSNKSHSVRESDILSLTSENEVVDEEEEEEENVEDDDDYTDTDSIIDTFGTPSQTRLEMLFSKNNPEHDNLDNRINRWQNTVDGLVDDNVASWDLDENLKSKMLDTSIVHKRGFYGDDLMKNLSKDEYIKFKQVSSNLRRCLTRKDGQDPTLPEIINRILAKYLQPTARTGARTAARPRQRPNIPAMCYVPKTFDRINHLPNYESSGRSVEYSDTTLSLVLCGGSSWGDI